MSDLYEPVHRALRLMLVVLAEDVATTAWCDPASADATCDAIAQALDVLATNAPLGGVDDAEREAMLALRAELRAQLVHVRAAEPGAVKRLQGLLHLLIDAELRSMQRTPKVD